MKATNKNSTKSPSSIKTNTNESERPKNQRKLWETKINKNPSNNLTKAISSDCLHPSRERNPRSRPLSQASQVINSSSQTVDVDSELFLKNAIIRYPSTHILNSLNSQNRNSRDQEENNLIQNNINEINIGGDGDTKRSSHLENLSEYLETGTISKKLTPSDSTFHPTIPQTSKTNTSSISFKEPPQTASSYQSNLNTSTLTIQESTTSTCKSSKINKNEIPISEYLFFAKIF